ncbi:hypothetical protein H1Z61_03045 [Bacillus aquiflavi]|uniref:Isoprenylcysteine carboxyl methyltransferase n=1 Tax=Bacillus aquiflavi TaxID=2672567 RepID=A0A6B3VYA5_9BACI|nr:isoprenylcysteine carboxylmethyltransferase family protein [Bacillus aquiflavi]MBA4536142.1 hypothetical protein [Bacillus aquiflavi]NEY80516.1 hypothetical protein [Bacillus aquiflavi]UAC47018.1 hypothetical protein K6959_09575 [Bacillus aquiflavi]
MALFLFLLFIILQRLSELLIAKRNEKWMKQQGALEFGEDHYLLLVMMHVFFFISLIVEVQVLETTISPIWQLLLILFSLTQVLRLWALTSLGKYWNTKIIVQPKANIVIKGPYRFMKHPNYVVVTLELLIIPFLFQAYITAVVFSLMNAIILSIRISVEEQALTELTEYRSAFHESRRFIPRLSKRL